jgi:large subunit ribosomal protein L15
MRLHDLKPAPGAHRERKRLGRGNATGQGTTAGKGTKGEKARSGGLKAGFRGMSSRNQRIAKRRGFTNRFKTQYQIVKLSQLARLEPGSTVSPITLKESGLINKADQPVKILGNGDIAIALTLVDVATTGSVRQKIEAAGGSVETPVEASSEEDTDGTGGA